jgi:tetratricopeptide (TPR) repeat protein
MPEQAQDSPIIRTITAAEKAVKKGDSRKAVALYSKAIEEAGSSKIEPTLLAMCHLNRGFALRKLGCQQEALQDYSKALHFNPTSFEPHLNAGLIYAQDFSRYKEALAEFDKALELNPMSTDALSSRGLTKKCMGDLEGAEEDLLAALSIEPMNVDHLFNLGMVYLQWHRPEKAVEVLQKALAIAPHDVEISRILSLTLELMKHRFGNRDSAQPQDETGPHRLLVEDIQPDQQSKGNIGAIGSDYKISVTNIVIIGVLLAAVEIVSAAFISYFLKNSVSSRAANNIWSLVIAFAFAVFWGTVQINKLGKGNHPIYGKPGFRREHLLAWLLSLALFLSVEFYLITKSGSIYLLLE